MSIHAIQQAKNRYGIDLTEQNILDFINQISSGKAKSIPLKNKKGNICPFNINLRAFEVTYLNKLIPVLWQKHKTGKQVIITILED